MNNSFLKQLINDFKIELDEEFDRNFERKAFFDKKWEATKLHNNKGSLLARSNKLRRSLKSSIQGSSIQYKSNVPYATIQNEGGEIEVTKKMKSFFWAMYYKAHNASNTYTIKLKKQTNTKRTRELKAEAQQWRNLALMKVGHKIKIEERQFIGEHPRVTQALDNVMKDNLEELNKAILNKLS